MGTKPAYMFPLTGTFYNPQNNVGLTLTWEGSKALWYTTDNGLYAAGAQLNAISLTYYVVAFLAADT